MNVKVGGRSNARFRELINSQIDKDPENKHLTRLIIAQNELNTTWANSHRAETVLLNEPNE